MRIIVFNFKFSSTKYQFTILLRKWIFHELFDIARFSNVEINFWFYHHYRQIVQNCIELKNIEGNRENFTFPNSVVISKEPSWGTMRKSPSELEKTLLCPCCCSLLESKLLFVFSFSDDFPLNMGTKKENGTIGKIL